MRFVHTRVLISLLVLFVISTMSIFGKIVNTGIYPAKPYEFGLSKTFFYSTPFCCSDSQR